MLLGGILLGGEGACVSARVSPETAGPYAGEAAKLHERALDVALDDCARRGAVVFDGGILALDGFDLVGGAVRLRLRADRYLRYLSSLRLYGDDLDGNVRRRLGVENEGAFGHPATCSALSVDTFVLCSDERWLRFRRARRAATFPGATMVGVGESLEAADADRAGDVNLREAAARGVREETGCESTKVVVLGAGVSPRYLDCACLAACAVPSPSTDVLQAISDAHDSWESDRVTAIPLSAEASAQALAAGDLCWSQVLLLELALRHHMGAAAARAAFTASPYPLQLP